MRNLKKVMNPVYMGAAIELVRMAMQLWIALAAQAGMSEEEMDKMLAVERSDFMLNNPDLLPKPPKDEEEK